MTYESLLRSALSNATRGMSAEQAALIVDGLSIADTLFPVVSQAVCEAIATDDYKRQLLLRQKTLTFAAGVATIPTDVLQNYIWDSTLLNTSNLNQHYAYRDYPDFVRRGDTRLGIYSIRGNDTLVMCDPGVPFASPLTSSGTRILNVPSVIEKPATATTDIDCPSICLTDLDEALSESLRSAILVKTAGAQT